MDSFDVQVRDWFVRRTHRRGEFAVADVGAMKNGATISAILPARDEEQTLPAMVRKLQQLDGLIDEILVVDSRSTDGTVAVARAAGATVHRMTDTPGSADSGKGGAMRLGVDRMTGDIGVFLDADIVDFDANFAVALLGTLLSDESLQLVKGFYDRPFSGTAEGSETRATGGGRVTELVARPLIAQRAPLLAGFAQPLAGEIAFRRSALHDVALVSGYGVDIALLLAVLERFGLDAMAQVDLGVRLHGHQELDALGSMALQVAAAFDLWLDDVTRVDRERVTIRRSAAGLSLDSQTVSTWLLDPVSEPSDDR